MTTRTRRPASIRFSVLALALLLGSAMNAHAEASDPTLEAVQRELAERGYDPGPIDGSMGERTRSAIMSFQRSVGLPESGEADDATRTALGLEPRSASRSEPIRAAGRRLSFTTLGWLPPQTGAEALARFEASAPSPELRHGKEALFVPKGELVFLLEAGERVPGFDCDPRAGRITIEFVFGPNGPIIFTPIDGSGYCQMGFGIALEVGGTLEMQRAEWGDKQYPKGTVRITENGLEYTR